MPKTTRKQRIQVKIDQEKEINQLFPYLRTETQREDVMEVLMAELLFAENEDLYEEHDILMGFPTYREVFGYIVDHIVKNDWHGFHHVSSDAQFEIVKNCLTEKEWQSDYWCRCRDEAGLHEHVHRLALTKVKPDTLRKRMHRAHGTKTRKGNTINYAIQNGYHFANVVLYICGVDATVRDWKRNNQFKPRENIHVHAELGKHLTRAQKNVMRKELRRMFPEFVDIHNDFVKKMSNFKKRDNNKDKNT